MTKTTMLLAAILLVVAVIQVIVYFISDIIGLATSSATNLTSMISLGAGCIACCGTVMLVFIMAGMEVAVGVLMILSAGDYKGTKVIPIVGAVMFFIAAFFFPLQHFGIIFIAVGMLLYMKRFLKLELWFLNIIAVAAAGLVFILWVIALVVGIGLDISFVAHVINVGRDILYLGTIVLMGVALVLAFLNLKNMKDQENVPAPPPMATPYYSPGMGGYERGYGGPPYPQGPGGPHHPPRGEPYPAVRPPPHSQPYKDVDGSDEW